MPAKRPKAGVTPSNILQQLEKQTRAYSDKATQLSNLLQQADNFLRQMPGKAEIDTEVNARGFQLAFCRVGGDWTLRLGEMGYGDNMEWCDATTTSISNKVQAAMLLPQLYQRFIAHIANLESDIDKGLASLQELPFLDFEKAAAVEDHSWLDDLEEQELNSEGGLQDDEIPF